MDSHGTYIGIVVGTPLKTSEEASVGDVSARIIIEVKPLQLLKADAPIEVTEFGIVIDVNPSHQ